MKIRFFMSIVGLFAALWRRLSRAKSLQTRVNTATSEPRMLAEDVDDADRNSLLGVVGTQSKQDGGPDRASVSEEVPEEEDVPERKPQPYGSSVAIVPSASPSSVDAAVPVVSGTDNGVADDAELDPLQADGGETLPEATDSSVVAVADGAVEIGADAAAEVTAEQDDSASVSPVLVTSDAISLPEDAAATVTDDVPEPLGRLLDESPPISSDQLEATSSTESEVDGSDTIIEATPEPLTGQVARPKQRRRRPAVHRDRRGKRRAVPASEAESLADPGSPSPTPAVRPPAEAKLRLSLDQIRRTVDLSVVLTRPDGFPESVEVQTAQAAVSYSTEAYDEQRYDDLDLPWTSELLDGELRFASADGLQWLRSARKVHIFAEDTDEPELISLSAVRAGMAHTLVCRIGDVEAVCLAAVSTGSQKLQTHEQEHGIPEGWMVLSDYIPMHAAKSPLPPDMQPLDPGEGLEIVFVGGPPIRAKVYDAGHPPQISITPAPGSAMVTIDGKPATLSPDGAWIAPGWDAPGQHMVDVTPGPSKSYEIAADPWSSSGWEFWDAYPERFKGSVTGPWAQSRICGARVRGPADGTVVAAETKPTLVALGLKSGATPLQRRDDAVVSVGLMAGPPAFLLSATGSRRTQGRIVWLGLASTQGISRQHDKEWVNTVRSATARRLRLDQADVLGEDAWRKAKERARRLRRRLRA